MPGVVPLFDARVVAGVTDDLRAIIVLLCADQPAARAVALAERLITRACSPLYGREVEPLRVELRRLAAMLSDEPLSTETDVVAR